MSIGKLRHRVQLQRFTEVQDERYGTRKSWETVATVFAEIKPVSGFVTMDTQQIEKTITHKVTIRSYTGLTSEWWLLMKGRRFRVRNVTRVDEKQQFMVLLCEEIMRTSDPFEVNNDAVGDPLDQSVPDEDA